MFKEQSKVQLIIASSILILTITGLIFGKTEYYFHSSNLLIGTTEISKEDYLKFKDDVNEKYLLNLKKKHYFNLPIGLVFTSISILVYTLLQSKILPKQWTVRIFRSKSLKEYVKFYYDIGFNLTIINGKSAAKNSYQDSFKIPLNEWELFREKRQTKEYITSLNWGDATGIGAISGINGLVCLDFDGCKDVEFIEGFLSSLGLPKNYEWVIRSGSYTGFHIWIKTSTSFPSSIPYPPNNTLYYSPLEKYSILFKQIELRLSDHVVLPPSKNRDGNDYKFLNNAPLGTPIGIEIIKIIHTIEKVAFCKNSYEYQVLKERKVMIILFINLESNTNSYEINFCTTDQYGGNATKISNISSVKNLSQLFEQLYALEIYQVINQADLIVLFETEDAIKGIIKHLKEIKLIIYEKPVLQLNELIKRHYFKGFNNLNDLYLTLFPFSDLNVFENINHLDIYIKSFFKLAEYFQDLRFKFKQYLNLDSKFYNLHIENTKEKKFIAVGLSKEHEFLLRFNISPDIDLTANDELKIRTILPLDISEDRYGQFIIRGFSFFESQINYYNLNDMRDLIINPQFIDYT